MENRRFGSCPAGLTKSTLRQPLAFRVESYLDESLSSVLMRLVDVNGLQSVGALLRSTGCVAVDGPARRRCSIVLHGSGVQGDWCTTSGDP